MEEKEFEYKQEPMYTQLAKVIDSVSAKEIFNPKGRVRDYFRHFNDYDRVITDDGDEFIMTPEMAKRIREAIINIDVRRRGEVLNYIQTSQGLREMMEALT